LTPAFAGLVKSRGSGLELLKSTFNAKNFMPRLFRSICSISAQFTLEMRVAARYRQKFTKTPYFEGSRSFKVSNVDIPKKLVANACCDKQHVCNHFHVRQTNNGRITLFKGSAPPSPSRSCGPSSPNGMKFCHEILETLNYHTVKTRSFYLNWSWNGTGT